MLMPKVKDPEFWKQVRTDPDYEPIVQQIKEYYDYAYMKEIPELTYYSRARYHIDGDRNEFQIPYFKRRQFLASAALLGMIYPEEQHYLDEVHEVIWAICDEYSWVLPAHGKGTLEWDMTHVDLFNAETGFALAELCYVLEDRLDPLVLNRARTEVRRRVFDNFLNETFEWETKTNNWAAVCAGCVGGAMMYLEPELFKEQLPRLLSAMGYFMKSFPEDGTCMEGFHYWHYGFGNFVWFADLLLQFTNGEVNLFTWYKVEAVSGYAQRCVLRGGTTVSYSDGERKGKSDRAMMHYLSRLFPEQVQLIPDEYTEFFKGNVTWMQTLRNLVYVDYTAKPVAFQLKDYDLPGAGQVVINREKYSLAVKAGHNAEAHNHNDVGNFILATDKGQIFCDLGAGLYTKQYFRDRYSVFCNASRGHNVPIINGGEQMTGPECCGTLTHNGNTIRMDFAGAYGQREVTKLTRTFIYEENRILLKDVFQPNYKSFTERFITTFQPVVHQDCVEINGVELCFDAEKVKISIQEVVHALHGYFEGTEIVYCIDFELNPGLEEITFTMKL